LRARRRNWHVLLNIVAHRPPRRATVCEGVDEDGGSKVTDASLPEGIGLPIVDETIASGFRYLGFPRLLEAAFERETGAERCRQLAIGAFVGLPIFDFFLLADWLLTPDVFVTALWVRLALVTPIEFALTIAFYWRPPVFLRESYAVVGTFLAAASSLYLMLLSQSPHQDSMHQSIILTILFVTLAQRVRFWYAIAACLGCFALHAGALSLLPNYPLELKLSANMVFGCVVVFTLFASYRMERELRLTYLFSLRGRLQNHELNMISRRDPLTGLGNRRSLDEALALCEQVGAEQLTLVMFDIDHFKMFNDAFGHQAGDISLKRVAGVLQAQLRDRADCAFRFGGEEFLVLLRATDLATGIGIAERLRRAIEEAGIPHPALSAGAVLTASFGVACATLGEDLGAADVIANADAALYAAKRDGRNRVWPPLPLAARPDAIEIARTPLRVLQRERA
jgi:diguanylate cyclase (GGDEF)-like protein